MLFGCARRPPENNQGRAVATAPKRSTTSTATLQATKSGCVSPKPAPMVSCRPRSLHSRFSPCRSPRPTNRTPPVRRKRSRWAAPRSPRSRECVERPPPRLLNTRRAATSPLRRSAVGGIESEFSRSPASHSLSFSKTKENEPLEKEKEEQATEYDHDSKLDVSSCFQSTHSLLSAGSRPHRTHANRLAGPRRSGE